MRGRHLVTFSLQPRRDPAQLGEDRPRQSRMNGAAQPEAEPEPEHQLSQRAPLPKRRKCKQKQTAERFGFTALAAVSQISSSPPQTPSTRNCLWKRQSVPSRSGSPQLSSRQLLRSPSHRTHVSSPLLPRERAQSHPAAHRRHTASGGHGSRPSGRSPGPEPPNCSRILSQDRAGWATSSGATR